MFTKQNILLFFGTLLVLSVLFYLFIIPTTTPPWEATGRLVLAVRTVPGDTADTTMYLGIDDVELYSADGTSKKATVLSRRMELIPGSDSLKLVLDTSVPVGNYIGFGFVLKSPELRNSWELDEAPTTISLVGDTVRLESPYTIEEDVTTAVILSFETLQAVHESNTAKQYLPVIQIETRSKASTIILDTEETVQIEGGTIQNSATYGMDWNGKMKYNFRASPQGVEEIETEIPQNATTTEESTGELPLRNETSESTSTASTTGEEMSDTVQTEELLEEEVEVVDEEEL